MPSTRLTVIRAMGHEFEWLLIDARGGAAASAAARTALARRPADVVVIGGGVRLDPAQTPMLEALVNVVIEGAPGVRIVFNTSPTDTAEAITRRTPTTRVRPTRRLRDHRWALPLPDRGHRLHRPVRGRYGYPCALLACW